MNTNSIRSNTLSRAFSALSLLCVCGMAATSQAGAQQFYVQTATSSNRVADWTNLWLQDTNPNDLYFVTPNFNPPGLGGIYDNHPIGVWFTGSDWAIFHQDSTSIPLGASYNVMKMPAGWNDFVHTATASNCAGDYTTLNNIWINGRPNELLWVTPNYNPGGKGGVYDNHNIGVWYNSATGRWAIFNQDHSAIPAGASFSVAYASGAYFPDYYVHTATSSNISGNVTFLDDYWINGSNGHIVIVTPVWNPGGRGGVYNNHAIGVWYDSAIGRYAIYNQDYSPMPPGAAFNVWVWY